MDTVSNRTIRRREKNERIKELLIDLDTVQGHMDRAIHPQAYQAYQNLYAKLYEAYISVVSSEV